MARTINKTGRLAGRVVVGCAVMLALAGCVTADNPSLSLEARRAFRLTAVDVAFAPGASTHISQLEDEVRARGLDEAQVAEAERAQIKKVVAAEFMGTLGAMGGGTRPVVAKVTVNRFNIPGPVATMVSGGSSGMTAGVDIVDAKSGETLVSIPPGKISAGVYRPSGILGLAAQAATANDPSELKTHEMAQEFAREYAQWFFAS